jgi:hypothetical protein
MHWLLTLCDDVLDGVIQKLSLTIYRDTFALGRKFANRQLQPYWSSCGITCSIIKHTFGYPKTAIPWHKVNTRLSNSTESVLVALKELMRALFNQILSVG